MFGDYHAKHAFRVVVWPPRVAFNLTRYPDSGGSVDFLGLLEWHSGWEYSTQMVRFQLIQPIPRYH